MTGCDKIEINRENGIVTIKFKRNTPDHILEVYKKLDVKPSFDCEVPLTVVMSEVEYEKYFQYQNQMT